MSIAVVSGSRDTSERPNSPEATEIPALLSAGEQRKVFISGTMEARQQWLKEVADCLAEDHTCKSRKQPWMLSVKNDPTLHYLCQLGYEVVELAGDYISVSYY